MSQRIDKSWTVFASIENDDGSRCVDIFQRPDTSFGFEEFRKDPEDRGAWTAVAYYSATAYPSRDDAMVAARRAVVWFGALSGH